MAEKAKSDNPAAKRGFSKGKAEQKKATPSKATRGRERQDTGKDKK
jgi:hypothetical protein